MATLIIKLFLAYLQKVVVGKLKKLRSQHSNTPQITVKRISKDIAFKIMVPIWLTYDNPAKRNKIMY